MNESAWRGGGASSLFVALHYPSIHETTEEMKKRGGNGNGKRDMKW